MKKEVRGQYFSGVRPLGGGWHRWSLKDKVTTKIVPNITNSLYAIFKPLSLWHI